MPLLNASSGRTSSCASATFGGMLPPRDSRHVTWDEAVSQLGGSLWVIEGLGEARLTGSGTGGQSVGEGPARLSFSATVTQGVFHDVYASTETSSRQGSEVGRDYGLLHRWVGVATPQPPVAFPVEMRADRWEADVDVEGATVQFVFVGQSDTWAALGMVGDHEVSVTARWWPADDLRLRRQVIRPRAEPPRDL